jgi:hypothetical protein
LFGFANRFSVRDDARHPYRPGSVTCQKSSRLREAFGRVTEAHFIVRDSGLENFSKIQSFFEMRHTFEVSCFFGLSLQDSRFTWNVKLVGNSRTRNQFKKLRKVE